MSRRRFSHQVARDVTKTKAGTFRARVMLGWQDKDGRRVPRRIERTFDTQSEAEEFRDEARRVWKYQSAGLVAPHQETAAGLNLKWLCENAITKMELYGRRPISIKGAKLYSTYLQRALGEGHAVPLQSDDVDEVVAWAQKKLKMRTPTGVTLRQLLQFIRTIHRRGELPIPSTPPIPSSTEGRRIFSLEDLGRLLAALPAGSVERAAVVTALLTVAREAEVLRLRVGDVDFDRSTVTLQRVKGWTGNQHGPKPVPMVPALAVELRAYLAGQPELGPDAPLLSKSRRGRPRLHLSPASLIRQLREASTRAGLVPPVTTFGWARNNSATILGELGVEDKTLQRLLGHATPAQTERYNRSKLIGPQESALRSLAGILKGGGSGEAHRQEAANEVRKRQKA